MHSMHFIDRMDALVRREDFPDDRIKGILQHLERNESLEVDRYIRGF